MKNVAKKMFYENVVTFLVFLATITLFLFFSIYSIKTGSSFSMEMMKEDLFVTACFLILFSLLLYTVFQRKNLKKNLLPMEKYVKLGKNTAQVVHDIKNPLSGIYVVRGFLNRGGDGSKERLVEAGNLLELSTRRLESMIDDFLFDFHSKEQVPVDLHHLLDVLIGEYSVQPTFEEISFAKHYHHCAISILGFHGKLERVMANLIKNAIEAMDDVGEIRVSTHVEGSQAYVAIQDNGPGMSQEMIASILNREGKTKGKKNGHGIGLQMVLDTIKEHKGSLNIESVEGEGAKFIISLPYAPELSKPFTIEVTKGSKVVIIDSDVASLDSWEAKLKEHNIETELFTSYEEYTDHCETDETARHCEAEGRRKVARRPRRFTRSNPVPPTLITDYYFEKSTHNGFQIVEELTKKGFTRMYVATKEYWKPSLQKAAKALKTKMCPKPLPPIEIELIKEIRVAQERKVTQVIDLDQQRPITVLVVDDEDSIHDTWGFTIDTLGVSKLHSFKSLEELQVSNIDLTKIDLAFVDKNIEGSQFTGADVLDYLKEQGADKVIVASGNDTEELKNDKAYAKADYFASEKIPLTLEKYLKSVH